MQIVYIASALRHKDRKGIEANMRACANYKAYARKYMGVEACALHDTLPRTLDDNVPEQRTEALRRGLELLDKCDCIYMCGTVLSEGMLGEVRRATASGKPVTAFSDEMSTALKKAGVRHFLRRDAVLGQESLAAGGYSHDAWVSGEVSYVKYQSASGFVVENVRILEASSEAEEHSVRKGQVISVAGSGLPTITGQKYEFHGEWTTSAKYGLSFKATNYVPMKLTDEESILSRLQTFPGVGATVAKRLFEKFGLHVLDVIEQEPEKLATVKGVSARMAQKLHAESGREKVRFEAITFLQREGITSYEAVKVYKMFGADTVNIVRTDTYRLCEVRGLDFQEVDALAGRMGTPDDSPLRIKAASFEVLRRSENEGNTGFDQKKFGRNIVKVLSRAPIPMDAVSAVVTQMLRSRELVSARTPDKRLLYRPYMYEMEKQTAEYLARAAKAPASYDREVVMEQLVKLNVGSVPDKYQDEAVVTAVTSRVCCILGGAGRGKTTVLDKACTILKELGEPTPLLLAFTGRAAARARQVTGLPAYTIDSMVDTDEDGHVIPETLEAKTVIIDEMSMVDTEHLYMVLKAAARDTRFIFVGDPNQLPSIGAGNCLADIVDSGAIPAVTLKTNFRQKGGSVLAANGDLIAMQRTDLKMDKSFQWHDIKDPRAMQEKCVELYRMRVQEYGPDGVFVICPQHKGEAGVEALNARLQAEFNPPADGKPEYKFGRTVFRVGDPVMHLQNDRDLGVVNGDTGRVVSIDRESAGTYVTVNFPDYEDKKVRYLGEDLENLTLSYAGTVHKAQGAEYPSVILCGIGEDTYYKMLNTNLLYTSITRSKHAFDGVGEYSRFISGIKVSYASERETLLKTRLEVLTGQK